MVSLLPVIAFFAVLTLVGFMLLGIISMFILMAEWENATLRKFAAYNCAATIGAVCAISQQGLLERMVKVHIGFVEQILAAVRFDAAITLWRSFMNPGGAFAEILVLGMGAGCLLLLLIRKCLYFHKKSAANSRR
jgi:hypothetical protein